MVRRTVLCALLACVATLVASAPSVGHAREEPGRYVGLAIGALVNPSLGHATRKPPALLTVPPTLELSWGIRLSDDLLLTTRLDMLGAIMPIGPAGYGADLGLGYSSSPTSGGWMMVGRATIGGLYYVSGGEALGPDYQGGGFRLGLDGGLVHRERVETLVVEYGFLVGVHATGITSISPCNRGDDCSDAFIGPTFRFETGFLF